MLFMQYLRRTFESHGSSQYFNTGESCVRTQDVRHAAVVLSMEYI